jgi:hypothetical protein
MHLDDHGTFEISLPWWSYFSYTIKLFSITYLCELSLWLKCGWFKARKCKLFSDIWCIWLLKWPKIWLIGSFMTIPPIIGIGQYGANFREKYEL